MNILYRFEQPLYLDLLVTGPKRQQYCPHSGEVKLDENTNMTGTHRLGITNTANRLVKVVNSEAT